MAQNQRQVYMEEVEDGGGGWDDVPAPNTAQAQPSHDQESTNEQNPFAPLPPPPNRHQSQRQRGRPSGRIPDAVGYNLNVQVPHINGQPMPHGTNFAGGPTGEHTLTNTNPFTPMWYNSGRSRPMAHGQVPGPGGQQPMPYPSQPYAQTAHQTHRNGAEDSARYYAATRQSRGHYSFPPNAYYPGAIAPPAEVPVFAPPHYQPKHHSSKHRSRSSQPREVRNELGRFREELDAFKSTQDAEKQHRRRADRRQAEAADQEKERRKYEKLNKKVERQVERKVEAEISKKLTLQARDVGGGGTYSDLGMAAGRANLETVRVPLVAAPVWARPDVLARRDPEAEFSLQDIADFVEAKRSQVRPWPHSRPGGNPGSAGQDGLGTRPASYHYTGADPNLEFQVERVVRDVLRNMSLGDNARGYTAPPPPPSLHPKYQPQLSGNPFIPPGEHRRSHEWVSDMSSGEATGPATPTSGREGVNNHGHDRRAARHPATFHGQGRHQGLDPRQSSRTTRPPHRDPMMFDVPPDTEPGDDDGYNEHRAYDEAWHRERGNPFASGQRPPADHGYGMPRRHSSRAPPAIRRVPGNLVAQVESVHSDGQEGFLEPARGHLGPHLSDNSNHDHPPPMAPDPPRD